MTGTIRAALLVLGLAVLAAPLAAQGDTQGDKKKEKPPVPTEKEIAAAKERAARLFDPREPLEFTLTADFKKAFKSKDTLDVPRTPATITVKDTSGKDVTIPLEIAPRGHFRLQKLNCGYPPIRLIFGDSGRKGTPFAGQDALKLGTHCRSGDKELEEIPLREHLLYRWYNTVTDVSYRSRLARVTYVDVSRENKTETKWGILIEPDGDMGKRNGGRERELRGAMFLDVDQPLLYTSLFYNYAIGNHDWSLYALHNMRIVATADKYLPAVYDFDFSGAARAPYSGPPPTLPIRKVTERLYRGPCAEEAIVAPIFAKYRAQQASWMAITDSIPGLSSGYVRFVKDYMEEFFRAIKDDKSAMRSIMESCNQRPSA